MPRTSIALLLTLALAGCAGSGAAPADSGEEARLETSPRHHEWMDVDAGDRTVRAFVAFPERAEPGPAVLLIHENRGLNTWARETADRLAEEGFLTVAPDLLSGTGPGGGGTEAFADSDAARTGIYALPPAQVTTDLQATLRAIRTIPACNGRVAVIGFCWGGSQTFRFATSGPEIALSCVFYGTAPEDPAVFSGIGSPVYGFYGGNDARVNATLPATEAAMAAAGKPFDWIVYEGAGHAFLRRGGAPDGRPEDRSAHDAAWERLLELLRGL